MKSQPVLGVGKGGSDLALSGPAELAPHHEHNQTALEHTPHTPNIRQGDGLLLYPTPWIPVCVACMVWRAKAIQPRPRRGAGTPPGTWDFLAIKLCVSGKSPRLSRSAKAQVLPERPRSSLYRRLPRPPFYTPLTVSAYACGYQKISKKRSRRGQHGEDDEEDGVRGPGRPRGGWPQWRPPFYTPLTVSAMLAVTRRGG